MNDPFRSPPAVHPAAWRFVVPALVVHYLGCDLGVYGLRHLEPSGEWLMALLFGTYAAQLNLIAIWGALAPGRIVVRLPWAWFLATLMWCALVLGSRFAYPEGQYGPALDRDDALTLGAVLLFGVVTAQVPLWIARRWSWRLVLAARERDDAVGDERQFSLRQLLAGMTLFGVALGLVRGILPPGVAGLGMDHELLGILIVLAIVNMLVVLPCVWGAFLPWRLLAALAALWLLYALVVTVVEIAVLVAFLGAPSGDPDFYWMFLLFNLTQCLAVTATLILLRSVGFRLVRTTVACGPPT